MSELEDSLKTFVTAIVDERLQAGSPRGVDEETQKRIAHYELISHKTYLNKKEIALYLSCSERSIEEWAARAVKDNPLPVGYAGSEMRGKREHLDKWTDIEAQRKRLKLAS